MKKQIVFSIIGMFLLIVFSGCDGKISCKEIDKGDFQRLDEDCHNNILRTCNDLIYELNLCNPMEEELRERIEWLEDVADIYGDTWREGDCGEEISKGQKEAGMDTFDAWKKNWG